MAIFTYKARDPKGVALNGEYEGASAQAVADFLLRAGNIPIEIKEQKATKSVGLLKKKAGKEQIKSEELIMMTRQMYTLIKAGVPLMQSLDGLEKTSESPGMKSIMQKLKESLDQGVDFTTALAKHPRVFSPLFVNLVRIGETTGNMIEVFKELSGFLAKDRDTQNRVKAALRYPTIVFIVIGLALIAMNVFIIPKFAAMYSSFGAELPLPTQIIMGFSKFLINYGVLLAGIAALSFYVFRRYIRTKPGRLWWHTKLTNFPIVGKLIMMAAITRFTRSMTITIKSGVPIEQALHVVGPAVNNDYIASKIEQMRTGVQRGESVSFAAQRVNLFPAIVVQMLAIGEQSGALDEITAEIAEYYERELDHVIQGLNSAIEPILIFCIAGMVLIMALGIFLPMWDMLDAMRK